MHHRTTAAGFAGALALSALTIPGAAQADDFSGDIRITKVVVNGGKDIILGTTDVKTFTIAVTATDDSGIEVGKTFPAMLHRPLPDGDYADIVLPDNIAGKCVRQSFTTTTCTYTLKINPRIQLQDNGAAGTWTVRAHALANDGDYYTKWALCESPVVLSGLRACGRPVLRSAGRYGRTAAVPE
ncbi:DUF5707 domain-containing protein [Streptomyces sp. NBC_00237]|uniref:DUF5707 domain-containing protein n=1 Tax=Streptomyces sp. NBC_00237 TaxID=2975687 RepID=UPI00225B4540|nr:DUF5707 domain-containing protein [Streptomyces sp. NBC_00237]MCX5206680.1 DUF5707 domain-containing protein [Streptomyces sp. NBC_00237]